VELVTLQAVRRSPDIAGSKMAECGLDDSNSIPGRDCNFLFATTVCRPALEPPKLPTAWISCLAKLPVLAAQLLLVPKLRMRVVPLPVPSLPSLRDAYSQEQNPES
jgi:hypothetical protein